MDLLRSKTVTASSGSVTVNSGLGQAQILGVFRQGEQKDKIALVSLATLNGSNWIFVPPNRISFGTSFPFVGSEKIRILYKVTV